MQIFLHHKDTTSDSMANRVSILEAKLITEEGLGNGKRLVEMVKAVQPRHFAAFSNILLETPQSSHSLQSSDIGQNSDRGISDFWISFQSLIKVNCHKSRTSDDIEMKLGPVTKLEKRNKATSKKFDDGIMLANFDVIVIFFIYGQFGASRIPDT